jgi:hypothetical protein
MKFLSIVLVCISASGCAWIQANQAQQQAQQEEFQREWDAMTPLERLQYQLAQQQLAAQGRPVVCTSYTNGGGGGQLAPAPTVSTVCQ